jgi:hypothetical protein
MEKPLPDSNAATQNKLIAFARKAIDILIIGSLYVLLVLSVGYAGYQLIFDVAENFIKHPARDEFPFILTFSEHIFLYFLPVFILFGLMNYYKFELRTYLLNNYEETKSGEKPLHLSKKLFFSNVLSYTSLKLIEELFFDFSKTNAMQLIAIGVFYFLLVGFVLLQAAGGKSEK